MFFSFADLRCGFDCTFLSYSRYAGAGGLFNSAGFSYFSRNWSNYFSPIGSLSKLGAPGFCYASGSNWVAGSRAVYGTGGPGAPVQRWLQVGPFFFQPSEFSKFTLVLALSHHFRDFEQPKGNWLWMIWPLALMAVPVVLIVKQPDLGTAMLLMIVFVPIIFLMGIRLKTIFILIILALASLPIVWIYVLKSYQKGRILTFLDPERDPLGSGYHIIQSKIAIGSGGVFGKGFGEGEDKYANLWDFPKKEFCKKCYWDNKNAPTTMGQRFTKVEHKSYMTGGSSQRFDDDDPVDTKPN